MGVQPILRMVVFLSLMVISSVVRAEVATIAVASNFMAPAKAIQAIFHEQQMHRIRLVFGSSGKLYAQIKHGAPFHVFLSADRQKPLALANESLAIKSSLYNYAQGRIALWSMDKHLVDKAGAVLREGNFKRLAIANPALAPYGRAAVQVLDTLSLYGQISSKLVVGENIAQTYQFVGTENAQLGFVAVSQVMNRGQLKQGSVWLVPRTMHEPIYQDMVLLKKPNAAARSFAKFMKTEDVKYLVQGYGYDLEPAI